MDPKFLTEPLERRVAVEAARESLELLGLPQLAKDQVRLAAGPDDRSDEATSVKCCPIIPLYYTIRKDQLRARYLGLRPLAGDEYVALQWY